MIHAFLSAILLSAVPAPAVATPETGTTGRYTVLTCKADVAPPFEIVEVAYGPPETVNDVAGRWLAVRGFVGDQDLEPTLEIQLLAAGDPLRDAPDVPVLRYLLRIPDSDETLEYRDVHTRRALLPTWARFQRYFLPHAAFGSTSHEGYPRTATYLGQVLTLKEIRRGAAWKPMQPRQLDLDPELLVGAPRNFKDQEGRRLPQKPEKKDYTYVRFTAEDYATMIAAGSNIFMIGPEQESFVRDKPVFYVRLPSSKAPLRWPADLYRSNYLGSQMFMDEPAIITVGDSRVNKKIDSSLDFVSLVRGRTHAEYESQRFSLEKILKDRKVNLGDMRIEAWDFPVWETFYEAAFYEMAGGSMGIVHEGRYRLDNFNREIARQAGVDRQYTVQELLRYYYATLRGASRPFGKHWGTAIYGQCDPKIAPAAVTQAYDMGARYIWFWTSDHEHHLPWVEQMELTRVLRKHANEHPRPSIFDARPVRDLAIVIPYGRFLSLENLWFIRELDPKREDSASAGYGRILNRAFKAITEALDHHEDFDITVDDGREITGYKRVVRLGDEPASSP